MLDSSTFRARLASVHDRVTRAAGRSGRDPASIRLVAISKTFPAEYIRVAAEAGQIDFGENKVQEALQKMDQTADLGIRWHLVGHLQSNKVRKAGGSGTARAARKAAAASSRFDVIHSVDDGAMVTKLDEAAAAVGREVTLLVQVDLAGEPTKHGAREDALEAIFRTADRCRCARVRGLMVLPPEVDDPEAARPYFRALKNLRDRLRAAGVDPGMLTELSMGMSHDFEAAVEEGATLIRVGTAIFGSRSGV